MVSVISISAVRDGPHPSIQIDLGWTLAHARNVMVVRRTGAAVAFEYA